MSKEEKETQKDDKKEKAPKKLNKTEALKAKIVELEADNAESKDKYLRLYADFDNYKRRTVRERLELFSTAARETLTALLPILDDFDRAKKSAEDENNDEVFSEGVNMVFNKLQGLMTTKGVKAMESNGETFDPELHEAITEIPAPTEELKGKIIDTVEKGYFLNDKIIRHAKVVVGK